MTLKMRWNWPIAALGLAVLLLLAYAWIDGGAKPVRPISETVVLPGAQR